MYKIDIWSSHNVKGEGELMKRDETLRVEGLWDGWDGGYDFDFLLPAELRSTFGQEGRSRHFDKAVFASSTLFFTSHIWV